MLEFIVNYSNEIVLFCIHILKYHIIPHTYMWSLRFNCFTLKSVKINSGNQATVIQLVTMFNIFNRRLKSWTLKNINKLCPKVLNSKSWRAKNPWTHELITYNPLTRERSGNGKRYINGNDDDMNRQERWKSLYTHVQCAEVLMKMRKACLEIKKSNKESVKQDWELLRRQALKMSNHCGHFSANIKNWWEAWKLGLGKGGEWLYLYSKSSDFAGPLV